MEPHEPMTAETEAEKRHIEAVKALNFLVGEVLKKTNYKADPVQVRRLIVEQLSKPMLPNIIRIPENTRVENGLVFIEDSMFVIGAVSPLNPDFMEVGTQINFIGGIHDTTT